MTNTFSDKSVLVIGATGLLGNALFKALQDSGIQVTGTSRQATSISDMMPLDVANEVQVAAFPWHEFDTIFDCSGHIDYTPRVVAAQNNIKVNVLGPLAVIAQLKKTQHYFHCSTHVVELPDTEQNTYSLSKRMIELYLTHITDIAPSVTTVRLPGIFFEHRHAGVLYRIKKHCAASEPLSLDFRARLWHCMYLPRVVTILIKLLTQGCDVPLVTIGYPYETRIEDIVATAEKTFLHSGVVTFSAKESDGYIPDTTIQSKYISVHRNDFLTDLEFYFRAP